MDDCEGNKNCDVVKELARIALASLEAEPVAYIIQDADARSRGEKGILRYFANISDEDINEYQITVTPLYTAPPVPVSVPDEVISAIENLKRTLVNCNRYNYCSDAVKLLEGACRAAMLQGAESRPELTVWYGSMPESNGKANWTAILHRKGEGRCIDGFTIDRSEYPGRVLYAADRVRYLIGEKSERPSILNYDADAHSGYVKSGNSPVIPDGWALVPVEPTPDMRDAYNQAQEEYEEVDGLWSPDHQWKAMLAAAPQQELK
ncbi:hypothetical protein NVR52_16145 [Enterobacter roggenkampii]|uniref:hypothetical protein n=1 Tax=Enterobacter roggenkampii TaxID=1812935 RepID=UPI00254C33DA|nr:hypothetical protein [Enterobacter roggenkampii]MDK9943349.1 hypothetical protein [Enterobacter roggenkampii]MDK9947539.1 hypothetical protein [Enterobacter roggenkampii]